MCIFQTADRLASPIRSEAATEFVEFRVHITIPGHLAEDLIATEPTLG
jgi:hypothetical protein